MQDQTKEIGMKQNEANWERITRVVIGVALIGFGFASLGGIGGSVLGVVGLVLLATGIVGTCPIYAALKFSTKPTT
jgi:Inner membrane protein YgaP-like, transmembrane domain